ncbi:MAG: deoxynucleoside kinase, partial [Candidatus Marinimicrobia bacterium]|nr:deoxynucleoside kinase [Candidatus Neomarinimicrobiota bacterium]
KPDLIIYLKASTDTLLSRIENRDRDYEKTIDPEYLHRLNVSYDRWINGLTAIPVLVVETDQFNIFTDQDKLTGIIAEMTERLTI